MPCQAKAIAEKSAELEVEVQVRQRLRRQKLFFITFTLTGIPKPALCRPPSRKPEPGSVRVNIWSSRFLSDTRHFLTSLQESSGTTPREMYLEEVRLTTP